MGKLELPKQGMKKITCALSVVALAALTTLRNPAQSTYEPYTSTTLAGGGGYSTNQAGSTARFSSPLAVAADSSGNIYVANSATRSHRVGDGIIAARWLKTQNSNSCRRARPMAALGQVASSDSAQAAPGFYSGSAGQKPAVVFHLHRCNSFDDRRCLRLGKLRKLDFCRRLHRADITRVADFARPFST